MDPKNPLVLYAATYDKVRKPWTFAEGGPGSGIYKTIDAGKTWTKLGGGLPVGVLGRIGLSISTQDPMTVYAVIENVGLLTKSSGSATPRVSAPTADRRRSCSDRTTPASRGTGDAASGARRTSAPQLTRQGGGVRGWTEAGGGRRTCGNPGYYYAQVRVDPNDKETVYVLSVGWSRTQGRRRDVAGHGIRRRQPRAVDRSERQQPHAARLRPRPRRSRTTAAQSWLRPDNLPVAQYYAIGFDYEVPYNVYGGTQDNGCHMGPSTRRGGGNIPFEEWANVGCADGFYNEVDWKDSRWLYNESQFGGISRMDLKTGQSAGIGAGRPALPAGAPYRWNWSAPIQVSPHNADVVYHAAQVLLRSPFRGERWEVISPDLTVNDPAKQGGGGNITYATITTIDESPIVPGLIWAGTDDGNVQVTKDGGQNWTNVRDKIPGHPGYWVSRVGGVEPVTWHGLRDDDRPAQR